MANQINAGVQRQSYEPFETVDADAGNSSADASLADDSTGAHTGGNPTIVAPHLEGESINPAPPETVATSSTLNRYGIGDTVITGRPLYAMPDYNPAGNTTAAPNLSHVESPVARHDATSWMKEASISGSNDSGGSIDGGGDEADYGGGDYGGGGDVGGGGDGGSGPTGAGEDNGGNVKGSSDGAVDQHGSGDFDGGGDSYSGDNAADSANAPPTTTIDPNSNCVATYPTSVDANGQSVARMDTIQVITSRSGNDGAVSTNAGSHGGSLNDYLSVDGYGVGSGNINENTNADLTQSTTGNSTGYQNAIDAASRLLGKPQGAVTYDDVLGALTQIRGASQNPELTMREQQALNSVFMAVYTRGNTERVIGPTVTNEFLNAAITSMMLGGGNARMPKPTSPTGPMLPGTTGDFARYRPPIRETWQQSERDIGRWLGANNRGQVSYLGGREVAHGTPGSVRPDFVSRAGIASFEVKNYNIATNMRALIQNVSSQAIDRARNLPAGMRQQIIIDVRGQSMSDAQRAAIINGIVQQSNGTIQPEDILFIR